MSEEAAMQAAMQKRLLELSDPARNEDIRAAAAMGIGMVLAAKTLATSIDKFTETLSKIAEASKS